VWPAYPIGPSGPPTRTAHREQLEHIPSRWDESLLPTLSAAVWKLAAACDWEDVAVGVWISFSGMLHIGNHVELAHHQAGKMYACSAICCSTSTPKLLVISLWTFCCLWMKIIAAVDGGHG
ncbi:hypothetical protein ACLOJK_027281, partial [Asimina triloba]